MQLKFITSMVYVVLTTSTFPLSFSLTGKTVIVLFIGFITNYNETLTLTFSFCLNRLEKVKLK